ncbi:uncharacterized protein M421DRAFT_39650, partial [Didymella exigua CBS 183.55]
SKNCQIQLALKALKQDPKLSLRHAAAIYKISQSTLSDQYAGQPSRVSFIANLQNLDDDKERVVIQYIRKLDARGFAPTLSYVREMANQLL